MRRAGGKSWLIQWAGGGSRAATGWLYHRHRTHIDLLFVSPDHGRQGIGGALIEALCAQYPAQILTVDASITAKPVFWPWFKVVAEQRVAARGSGLLITGWKARALR
jgi:GNAT superfamily N-acetyltransferase